MIFNFLNLRVRNMDKSLQIVVILYRGVGHFIELSMHSFKIGGQISQIAVRRQPKDLPVYEPKRLNRSS